jgi:small subunit ribosomal protein S11
MYKLFFKNSLNNLFCMVCDVKGKEFYWSSCGLAGFKGPARGTLYACEKAGLNLAHQLNKRGIKSCDLYLYTKYDRKIKEAVKALRSNRIRIKKIIVMPKMAHNGGRLAARKRR